ncbi:MAG TPA: hypothetical protein VGE13_03505 [Candidatus Saccharimonadales bacterium]
MKIPTKQHNTKRNFLAIGALAAIVGLSAPTIALAHGEDSDRNRSSDTSSHWRKDHHRWDSWHDRSSWFGPSISPEWFTKKNTRLLERYDSFIAKHDLTVENGDALKTDVETTASVVVNELTALKNLRDSIDELKDSTPEQRTELKEQLKKTSSAYLDYKFALYEYKLAIKAAADEIDINTDSTVKIDD